MSLSCYVVRITIPGIDSFCNQTIDFFYFLKEEIEDFLECMINP
jgi:hypothetical protein